MFSQNLLVPSEIILVGPGRERRAYPREESVSGISAVVEGRNESSALGARVVNISTAGLALQLERPHQTGAILSV